MSAAYILTIGDCDTNANLKSAVWAFDILKYAWPGLELYVVGDGPLRVDLEAFAVHLGHDDCRVRFLGWPGDITLLIKQATAVWLTALTGGSELATLASRAGVPVFAMQNPDLSDVPGVPQGDHVGLAARTLILQDDVAREHR